MKTPSTAKAFWSYFLPLGTLLIVFGGVVWRGHDRDDRNVLEANQRQALRVGEMAVTAELRNTDDDLILLAKLVEEPRNIPDLPAAKGELLVDFARSKDIYFKLRFLGLDGKEVFRINNDVPNQPEVVPTRQLQNKASRYFVQDTLKLERGEIYLSPLDLNIENDLVEQPYRPTLRLCTPLFDPQGGRMGLLVLNYQARLMLDRLGKATVQSPGPLLLANEGGYWLKGPRPEDEWGFMVPERGGRTAGNMFPDVWPQIQGRESGQCYGKAGLFTFTTLHLDQALARPGQDKLLGPELSWKLISYVPADVLQAQSVGSGRWIPSLCLSVLGLLAVICLVLARMRTARRRAQALLAESESWFRHIYKNSPVMMHSLDEEGRYCNVNDKWLEETGYTRAEVLGQRGDFLMTEESSRLLQARMADYWRDGQARGLMYQFIRKDGSLMDIQLDSNASLDFQGRQISLTVIQNVTERKQAEQAVRESERRYRELIESIYDFIWETDPRGVFTFASERCRNLMGIGPEGLIGRSIMDFIAPEQGAVQETLLDILFSQQEPFSMVELTLARADGRRVILECNGTPELDEAGATVRWRGVSRDITTRKMAEEGLMKAHLEMEAVLAGLPEVLVEYLDPEMRIVWSNMKSELVVPGGPGELKGCFCHKVYQGMDAPCPGCTAFKALQTGRPQEGEIVLPDGRVRLARSNPMRDGAGNVVGVVHVALDITARKRAEHTLHESESRFSKVFLESPMPMALSTVKGCFIEANHAFLELLGYPAEELFGQSSLELCFYENPGIREKMLATLEREGGLKNYEVVMQTRDRRKLDILLSMVVVHMEGQQYLLATLVDVTERKRMEADLAEVWMRMQALFDTTQDAIFLADDQMRYVDVNPSACALLGYTREELLELTIPDLLIGREREEFIAHWTTTRNKTGQRADGVMRCKDGRMVDVDYRAVNNFLPGLHMASIRDITASKEAERGLREAQAFLNGVMDALTAEVVVLDASGQVVLHNEAWAAFARKNGGALKLDGWNYLEVCRGAAGDHASQGQIVAEGIERVLRGEQATFYHEYACHSPQARHWFEMRVSRLQHHGKDWAIVSHEEITERMRVEEELRRFRAALDNSADSVFLVDRASMRFIDLNYTACRDLGYTREELLTMGPGDIAPSFRPEELTAQTEEGTRAGERKGIIETMHRRKDGTEFPVEVRLRRLHAGDGNELLISAVRDVTERMRAQQALQAALKAAEASSIAKGQFLANMSHEIRTPMNAVIGMTRMLLETPLGSEQKMFAETVARAGEALLQVINDILDFSKIEAGRLELETTEFDLRETVEETAECLAFQAHQKKLELVCQIDGGVPAVLRGDPGRLRQVLVNLIGNAIKFTERGEVVLRVACEGETAGRIRLRISIRDTGIGIPADLMGRLFQAFSQVDSSMTRRYGGTGLGLAICQRLIELMGGRIEVESLPGQGSTFWFTLELEKVNLAEARMPERFQGRRVLVAVERATSRQVLLEQLHTLGCLAAGAGSGGEALDLLRGGRQRGAAFEVALLDQELPDQDGLTLARRIEQEDPAGTTALILLASPGHPGQGRLSGDENRFKALFNKPVKYSRLCDGLAAALSQRTPAAAEAAPEKAPPPAGAPPQPDNPGKILLAEDNWDNQMIIHHILKRGGWVVDTVNNGHEALAALEREDYALVLMDIQMPVLDGLEATREIRRREQGTARRVPIIAMTAHAMNGDREIGLEVGMDAYLTKPVDPSEMITTVQAMMTGAAQAPSIVGATSSDVAPTGDGLTAAEAEPRADVPPEPERSGSTFDPSILLNRLDGDREVFRLIIDGFLDEAEKHVAALVEAWAAGDGSGVKFHAHAIKGSSANIGAEEMRQIAQQAETLGGQGTVEKSSPLQADLTREFQRLRQVLERLEV